VVGKPKSAEMHTGPGFRLRRHEVRPSLETVDGLGSYPTPAISDIMNRLYALTPAVRPMTDPALRLLGAACTVKVFPGDNLMVHKALDLALPGDVIVVDASGSIMTAVLGDLVATKARHRGIKGFVVDGLIRDLPAITELGDLPVFARGVTPIGPLHRGPGEVNYAISAGGIVVHPGDVVIGDANGVVIVPLEMAESILVRLKERSKAEADYVAAVAAGQFSNAWVDGILADAGVEDVMEWSQP
jgi:RraA family protein